MGDSTSSRLSPVDAAFKTYYASSGEFRKRVWAELVNLEGRVKACFICLVKGDEEKTCPFCKVLRLCDDCTPKHSLCGEVFLSRVDLVRDVMKREGHLL